MPLRFESLSARVVVVIVICASPALVLWNYVANRDAFSALSAANILLVQKVEKFDAEVERFKADNDTRFDEDEKKRRANMGNWVAQAIKSREVVEQIQRDLEQFKAELRFTVSTSEDYGWLTKLTVYSIERQVYEILHQVEATRAASQAAVQQTTATHAQLNQKLVTQPEADRLKKQAETLRQQNKELRRKKKPIFKLFLNRGKADH